MKIYDPEIHRLLSSIFKLPSSIFPRPLSSLNYVKNFPPIRRTVVILRGVFEAIIAVLAGALSTLTGISGVYIGSLFIGWAFVIKVALIGSCLWAASSSSKKSANDLSYGGMLINGQSQSDPVRIVYGEARIGASRVFIHTTGIINRYLHVVVIWCMGKVEGIKSDGSGPMIWFGEQRMQYYETFLGLNLVSHEFHDGDPDQVVSAALKAEYADWDDAYQYCAYSYFKLTYSQSAWKSFPEFTCIMKGLHIYDPRDGTTSYVKNPALVVRDFATNPIYAGGIDGSRINKQSVIDCANWCDTNSYYFNGGFSTRQAFIDNLEKAMLNCRMEILQSGTEFKLLVLKYDATVMELTENDVVKAPQPTNNMGKYSGSAQEVPKRVKVIFADPVDNYATKYAYWPEDPVVAGATDKADMEIELIGIADFELALKLAKFYYLQSTFRREFTLIAHARTAALEPGEMIEMTHDTAVPGSSIPSDWDGKVVRLRDFGIPQGGNIPLTVKEEDSSIYDGTVNIASHSAWNTAIPGVSDLPSPPTNPFINTGEDKSSVYGTYAYIEMGCDNMGEGQDYEFRYRKSTSTIWSTSIVSDPGGIVDPAEKTGTGTLKMRNRGNFIGASTLNYKVQIDGAGSPNTFKWSDDGGSTWDATGVAITGDWQELNNGVEIYFNNLTGGVIDDYWTFAANLKTPIKTRVGLLPINTLYYWQVCCLATIGAVQQKSLYATSEDPCTTWAPSPPDITGLVMLAYQRKGFNLLKWTPPTSREENIDTYILYRNTSNNWDTALELDQVPRQARKYEDSKDLSGQAWTEGTTYYYWIKAQNKGGLLSTTYYGPVSAASWRLYAVDPNAPTVPVITVFALPNIDPGYTMVKAHIEFTGSKDMGPSGGYTDGRLAGYTILLFHSLDSYGWAIKSATIKATANDETAVTYKIDAGTLPAFSPGPPRTTINYKALVQAYDEDGNIVSTALTSPTSSMDTTPPAAPTPWVSNASANMFHFTWYLNTEEDMEGGSYLIYVNTTYNPTTAKVIRRMPHPAATANVMLYTYTEDGSFRLEPDTSYYWWMTAKDRTGNESSKSIISFSGFKSWNGFMHRDGKIKDAGTTTVLTNDEFDDGSTYGRTKLTALTSGEVDLSKAGVLNKNLDNIADGVGYDRKAVTGVQQTGAGYGYLHLDSDGVKSGSKIYKTLSQRIVPKGKYFKLQAHNNSDDVRHFTAEYLCVHDNASPNKTILVDSWDVACDLTVNGPGGHFTDEAVGSSAYIYFYALYKSSDGTKNIVASTGKTTLSDGNLTTLGYDFWIYIGSCYVDADGDLWPMRQNNDRITMDPKAIKNDSHPASADTPEAISLAAFVPLTAKDIFGLFGPTATTVRQGMGVGSSSSVNDTWVKAIVSATVASTISGYGLENGVHFQIEIYWSGGVPYIYWASSSVSYEALGIIMHGYIDGVS